VEEPVHFGDVVAVLGRFKAHLPDFRVFSLEVGRQGFPQFGHGQLLFVEHQVFDRISELAASTPATEIWATV